MKKIIPVIGIIMITLLFISSSKSEKNDYFNTVDNQIRQGQLTRVNYQLIEWGCWKKIDDKEYDVWLKKRPNYINDLASVYVKDNTIVKIHQRCISHPDSDDTYDVYFYENGKIAYIFETNIVKPTYPEGTYKIIGKTFFDTTGKKISSDFDSFNNFTKQKIDLKELPRAEEEYEWWNLENIGSDICSFGYFNPFFNVEMKTYGYNVDDFFSENFKIYKSTKQIPKYLVSWFLQITYSNEGAVKYLDMAEPDGEYIPYDVIVVDGKHRPIQRLIFAGESKHYAFIYFEHGGFAPYKHLITFKKVNNVPQFYFITRTENRIDDFKNLKKMLLDKKPKEVSPALIPF